MTENERQRGTLSEFVQKELRVILSGNRSPLLLRIAKWALFLSITRRLYGSRWFRVWVFGLPLTGLATHLLYRHMTYGWTRPWGGWKDVEAANPKKTWRQRIGSSCWEKRQGNDDDRNPEVDATQGGSAPERLQLPEWDAGVVLVHRQQKRANDTPMQSVRPLQELDAVDPRQSDIGRDERHVLASTGQPLKNVEGGLRRALGDHPVFGAVSPPESALGRR